MAYYLIKVATTTLMVILISEIAKRSSLFGAILASIPLVSVLGILWLYIDTQNSQKVIALSQSIFWLVIPSLVLFIVLPLLLKMGVDFYISMLIAISATVASYFLMINVLGQLGVKL